jgi:RNA polymerase sigma-70 factor (ECF subfamily)
MNRSRDLFWNLVEPEHLKARAFCRKLMGNREDGDDLYQDCLVRALSRFTDLREIESFRSWLYRIVISVYRNRIRRPWWRRFAPLTADVASSLPGDNPLAVLTARRRLEYAFKALSSEDRALVTLFELQGWSTSDVAAMTGLSESNVRVRLSRARRKMRDRLMKLFERIETNQKNTHEEETICVATKPGND